MAATRLAANKSGRSRQGWRLLRMTPKTPLIKTATRENMAAANVSGEMATRKSDKYAGDDQARRKLGEDGGGKDTALDSPPMMPSDDCDNASGRE